MSLEIVPTVAFRRDVKRLKRSDGRDLAALKAVVEELCRGLALEPRFRDHSLSGEWKGCRECHVRPDLLLVYRLDPGRLVLVRAGSHAELFG